MIEFVEIESDGYFIRIVDVRKGKKWVRVLDDGYTITINPRGIDMRRQLIYRFEGGWLAAQAWAVEQLELQND